MESAKLKQQLAKHKRELLGQVKILQKQIKGIDSSLQVLQNGPERKLTSVKQRLREIVLFAIKQAQTEFTLQDIELIVHLHFPYDKYTKRSLASSFWKIAVEELKLRVVEQGRGQKPTIYSKK